MQTELDAAGAVAIDLARECLYRFLAAALSDPRSETYRLALDADNQRLARAAADLLRAEAEAAPVPLGFGELPAEDLDLAPVVAELHKPSGERCDAYDRAFGLVCAREGPPYETEYCPNAEPFFRAQQMADVAGFYRAHELETAQATHERPDHVSLELEFLAFVLLKKRLAADAERRDICDATLRSFFRDHVAWWLPAFATGLRRRAGGGLYAAVGRVLAALLPAERGRLGVAAPRVPLEPAPVEPPEESAACAGCPAAG
jgi:TorA maturation chaperone TorD